MPGKLFKKFTALMLAAIIAVSVLTVMPQSEAKAAFVIDYETHCDAIYMVNLDTGMVVYEKNADKQKYPASMTKVMTCMLALEYFSDPASEHVTIPTDVMNNATLLSNGVWSTGALKDGERLTLKDLLYCAMLPSDNYAALAIAYYVSAEKGDGTLLWFINRMNERAQELGCQNTQFINPHGLFHQSHYTTARDMSLIAQAAMQIPYFAEIVNEPVYRRAATNKNPEFGTAGYRLENTNKMLSTAYAEYYYQYIKGIKTGFIKAASHTFTCYATKDGYSYIMVLMDDGAEKNYDKNYCMLDAKALLQWVFSNIELKELVSADKAVATVNVDLAWSVDTLELYPAESYSTLMLKNVEQSSIMVKKNIPDTITAPVEKGEILGTADLVYGSEVVGSIQLVAGETVHRSELLYVLSLVNGMFDSPLFITVVVIIVLALAVYIIYSLMRSRSVGSLKRVRRYRRM